MTLLPLEKHFEKIDQAIASTINVLFFLYKINCVNQYKLFV